MIAPTVKTQARGQNDWSRAFKWGIVCPCSFNSFEVTIKYVQKLVFQIPQFCKKWQNHYAKLQKMRKSKKLHFLFFIISLILFELQRCTIPHFEALEKYFWPLAWVLTVGAITFVLLRKMSVYIFSWHTLSFFLSFNFFRVLRLN